MAREYVQITLGPGETTQLYGYRLDGADVTIEVVVLPAGEVGSTTVVRDGLKLMITLPPMALHELELTNATGPVKLVLLSGTGRFQPIVPGADVAAHDVAVVTTPNLKDGSISARFQRQDRASRGLGEI